MDTVRFWSMLAIVAVHCVAILTSFLGLPIQFGQALTTPFKFGTIAFFLISGFLLGERLETCRPVVYLWRRIQKVLLPWLLWFALFVTSLFAADLVHHRLAITSPTAALLALYGKAVDCAFGTAFWFVPNLLLALSILLLFRRHLQSIAFGACLFGINLLYIANIYGQWFPSRHTQALFAFVGYLWLGSFAARHFQALESSLAKLRTGTLLTLSILAGLAAYGEAQLLTVLKSPDPLNTLRVTNQIFSILVVLLLLKLRRRSWPSFVDVRGQTFGIYLSHSLLLTIIFNLVKRVIKNQSPHGLPYATALGAVVWITVFSLTYSISLLLTQWLGRQTSLRWSIGLGEVKGRATGPLRATPVELLPFSQAPKPTWT